MTNEELKTRMQALGSFESSIVCIIQDWDAINFGDVDISNVGEVARLSSQYVDTFRTDITSDDRNSIYQTVWTAFSQALPEIENPTE